MNLNSIRLDVEDFHCKFGHPAPRSPSWPAQDFLDFRMDLLREEVRELEEAVQLRDFTKVAREAIDVVYVTIGLLVSLGLPFMSVWRRVHKANMQKEPHPTEFRPIKPEGWVSPDTYIAERISHCYNIPPRISLL